MEKEDARFQTLEQLHERRKQVVRLHRKGYVAPSLDRLTNVSMSPGGHVMQSVRSLCKKSILLDDGEIAIFSNLRSLAQDWKTLK